MHKSIATFLAALILFAGLAWVAPCRAADDPTEQSAKEKDIRALFELTGQVKAGIQVADQMLTQFRTMMPQVPAEFWNEFQKDFKAQDIVDLAVPIYNRHFTHDEINEMMKFYQSPVGKKLTQELPQITAESFEAGREWGQQLGAKLMEKLKAEGYGTGGK